jgi:Trypsin-like peptidase domain
LARAARKGLTPGALRVSWAVSVTAGPRHGTGAVISRELVLTCWHVVRDATDVQVTIPGSQPRAFRVIDRDQERDLALLAASDSRQQLPGDVVVVPRAFWRGARPEGERALVELAITEADLPSSIDVQLQPAPGSAQHVEFKVPAARESVEHGFSGAPVIELQDPSATPRLLGIVRARDPERVDVLDRAGTGWLVPIERVAERFAQVKALIETPIERSPAWMTHWQPRSRGVASSRDTGQFFSGRHAACTAVARHLQGGPGLAIVTGPRGHGKSAVLAHVLAGACPRYRTLLAASDPQAAARQDS